MSTPSVILVVAKYHLGFFMARICDFMEKKTCLRFDDPDIEAKYVSEIVQVISERVEVDLSDFPGISSESILCSGLAKLLYEHYLKKPAKIQNNATGPPSKPS